MTDYERYVLETTGKTYAEHQRIGRKRRRAERN
jgi:hypothetical protein